jgi:hypothetical protein
MEDDENGIPLAAEIHTFDPKKPLPDLSAQRPTVRVVGTETIQTPKGPIECQKVEVTQIWRAMQDLEDSTIQKRTESKATRWFNPKVVPITGLVREQEHKVYTTRKWPVGKPSTDFPERITGIDDFQTELIDFGHGAKPKIVDRIRDIPMRSFGSSP